MRSPPKNLSWGHRSSRHFVGRHRRRLVRRDLLELPVRVRRPLVQGARALQAVLPPQREAGRPRFHREGVVAQALRVRVRLSVPFGGHQQVKRMMVGVVQVAREPRQSLRPPHARAATRGAQASCRS